MSLLDDVKKENAMFPIHRNMEIGTATAAKMTGINVESVECCSFDSIFLEEYCILCLEKINIILKLDWAATDEYYKRYVCIFRR